MMIPENWGDMTREEQLRWLVSNGLASEGYDPFMLKFGMSREQADAERAGIDARHAEYKNRMSLGRAGGAGGMGGPISGPGGTNPNPYRNIPSPGSGNISGPGGMNPYGGGLGSIGVGGGGFAPMSGGMGMPTSYNPYMNRRRSMGGYSTGGFASGLSGGMGGGGFSGLTRSY